MKLFFREYGEGEPMIIIHGFLGMSDNWITVGKEFSDSFKVYLIDNRNHGQSPHSDVHDYDAMSSDILEFISDHKIKRPVLIGHSMGGKAVLQFARKFPEFVNSIIIIDVSPDSNINAFVSEKLMHIGALLEFMKDFDFENVKDRSSVLTASKKMFSEEFFQQLILKNIKRTKDGRLEWKLNIDSLTDNVGNILKGIDVSADAKEVRSLFIFGKDSPYFSEESYYSVKESFPSAIIKVVSDAGHNIHIDNKDNLIKEIKQFLN